MQRIIRLIIFAFLGFRELIAYEEKFKKNCLLNRNNYWISFLHTKFKLEIKPFYFVRPRCFREQGIPTIKEIFFNLPDILGFFFIPKKLKKYNLNWCVSETWMELAYPTVEKLVEHIDKNPELMELSKYIYNPEEILLQTVINTVEKEVPRKDYLINCKQRLRKNRSLEIIDNDFEFVNKEMKDSDWLFMRKFNPNSSKILDFIYEQIKGNKK